MSDEDVPWSNSKTWKKDFWYPLPLSQDVEFNGHEVNVQGGVWRLFRLDPRYEPGNKLFGDIDCMDLDLSFCEAVKMANRMNPEKLWTFSWAKNLE